jgi:hypothetical protein
MPNEFKVKNGLIVDQGGASITGSSFISGALAINSSGSSVFTVDGTSGRLFSVDDSLSGSLFSVNTAAGLPVMEAFSDNTVRIGQYGRQVLFVSQSKVGVGKESTLNGILDVSGSVSITGSLSVSSGITGSLFGSASYAFTASYALNAGGASIDTGSFATTGSNRFIGNQTVTGSLTLSSSAEIELTVIGNQINTGSITATQGFTGSLFGTASWAQNAITASYVTSSGVYGPNGSNSILSSSFALTASYVLQAISASFAATASLAPNYVLNSSTSSFVTNSQTSSFVTNAQTSSFVLNSQTASMSVASASQATTASSADNFTVRGTLTAQTIVAQTITSSTDFVTGSTRFGSLSTNTHQFTGSVSMTGSLDVNGTARVSDTLTVGTSGNAIPATPKARFVNNTAGSDVEINGNGFARLYFNDYSRGTDLKYYEMLNYLGDWKISRLNDANTLRTERLTIFGATGNIFIGSSPSDDGFKFNVSGSTRLNGNTQITGSLSVTQGITGSLFGTSSWAQNAVTSSYILQAVSASFASTASYASNGGVTQIIAGTNVTISPTSGTGSVTINAAAGAAFPFTGSAIITGSLIVTGSTTSTFGFTGSLLGTASFATSSSFTLNIDGGFY